MCLENACYHLGQNLLSSIWYLKTYRLNYTGILFSILYGHETWSVTLTEDHSLSVFVEGAEEDI